MVSSDRTSPRYQVDLIRPAEICSVKANHQGHCVLDCPSVFATFPHQKTSCPT